MNTQEKGQKVECGCHLAEEKERECHLGTHSDLQNPLSVYLLHLPREPLLLYQLPWEDHSILEYLTLIIISSIVYLFRVIVCHCDLIHLSSPS